MKKYYSFAILILILCIIKTAPTSAQHSNTIQGYWMGNLKISTGEEIRIAFNILQASDNNYSATIDVPDQGAFGLPVSLIEIDNNSLLIKSTAIGAVFEGVLDPKEMLINGNFIQGDTTSLTMVPVGLNSIEGIWVGPLEIEGGEEIRALFEITSDDEDRYTAEFGIPEQEAMGLPVERIEYVQEVLNIEMKNFGISKSAANSSRRLPRAVERRAESIRC